MKRLLITSFFLASSQLSAGDPATEVPLGALYRYQTPSGGLVISNTLPIEAIYTGYDVIDSQGRVIQAVPPALPEEERQQRQQQVLEEQQRARMDAEIRRLYATPGDAERARDRQISTLTLSIEFARNTRNQLEGKLNDALAQAAGFEQQGQEVPPATTALIDSYSRQIEEHELEIKSLEEDIAAVREEFAPIIERLEASGAR